MRRSLNDVEWLCGSRWGCFRTFNTISVPRKQQPSSARPVQPSSYVLLPPPHLQTNPKAQENDSNVAAISSRPCLIARVELADYFTSTSVRIPDFSNEDLGSALAPLFTTSSRLSHEDIQRGLETAACWVAACQRVFAIISTGRTSPVEGLKEVRTVWEYVDHVHSAVQRLQQTLVKIDYVPEGLEGDLSAVDHYVLLGVRMDTRLVGLVNLMHRFLLRLGPEELREGERETRWQLVAESELRVRKCLKLHSFYAHVSSLLVRGGKGS